MRSLAACACPRRALAIFYSCINVMARARFVRVYARARARASARARCAPPVWVLRIILNIKYYIQYYIIILRERARAVRATRVARTCGAHRGARVAAEVARYILYYIIYIILYYIIYYMIIIYII